MRIDKLLWFLRFVKTRALGHALAEAGHIRVNGRRVERAALPVAVGDVLTLPLPGPGATEGVRVIEVLAIPARRGPAAEAQACYRPLDGPAQAALAQGPALEGDPPP